MSRPLPASLRVLAFEDGPFTSPGGEKAAQAALLGVATRGGQIYKLLTACIQVDGLDATERIIEIARQVRGGLSALLLHGLPYAGFNIVDAPRVNRELGLPVIAVLSAKPRRQAVERALRRHFSDWEQRIGLLKAAGAPMPLELSPSCIVYFQAVGIDPKSAEATIRTLTVFGKIPEPLRIARLVAEAFSPWALDEAHS